MSKAAKAPIDRSAAVITAAGEFRELPLSQLFESPLNTRKHYDLKKLAELTESIRAKWILTPMLARPNGGRFEIAAGHRRYRAALATGLDLPVPVMVREMTDVEFLEILTIENLQREDVHPLDEALGYRELLDKHRYTVDLIAERVGKSKEYVYGRMKLADLIPELQVRLYDEHITAGHAILLARLPEGSQVEAAKQLFAPEYFTDPATGEEKREMIAVSVRDLQSFIRRNIQMDLGKAPFDVADPDLVRQAGACIACPKRSGAEPQLWPEIGKRDLCADRVCFNKKLNAFIQEQVTSGQMVRLTDSWSNRDKKGMIYVDHHLVQIKGKIATCDSTVAGIYIDGHNRGETLQICPNKSCKVHYRGQGSSGGSYQRPKALPAEQLKNAQRSIDVNMDAEFRRQIYDAASQRLDLLGADLPKLANKRALLQILQLVYDGTDSSVRNKLTVEFGFRKGQYGNSARSEAVAKHAEKFNAAELMALTIKIALRNLSMGFTNGWNSEGKVASKELTEIADAYGVKTGPIESGIAKLKKEKLAKAKDRIDLAAANAKSKKKSGKKTVQTSAKAKSSQPAESEDGDTDDDIER